MPVQTSDRSRSQIIPIGGPTIDGHDEPLKLLDADFGERLRACESEISRFEAKYRSNFAEFVQKWEQDEIPNRRDHEVERDYMEWEGLVAEQQTLRALIEAVDDMPWGIARARG